MRAEDAVDNGSGPHGLLNRGLLRKAQLDVKLISIGRRKELLRQRECAHDAEQWQQTTRGRSSALGAPRLQSSERSNHAVRRGNVSPVAQKLAEPPFAFPVRNRPANAGTIIMANR